MLNIINKTIEIVNGKKGMKSTFLTFGRTLTKHTKVLKNLKGYLSIRQ
jgi:hypothetical protein